MKMRSIQQRANFGLAALLFGVALTLGGLGIAHAASVRGSASPGISTQQVSQMITGSLTSAPVATITAATATATATATTTSAPISTATSIAASTATSIATTTATGTATPYPTSTSTPTTTSTAASTASSQATVSLPAQATISNFPPLAQSYELSCEYAAASAITLFWGNNVSEDTFLNEVPSSPNPHLGFRGDINGAFGGINDYGVYAEALVPVLENNGYNATVFYGVDRLKANIAAGNPVEVWITVGRYTLRTPVVHTYNGQSFTLVAGEHAVVIYGYDSGGVYIMDVASGSYTYTPWDSFITRWSYFDQMALVITPR